jgi:hypothetical protein
MSSGVAASAWVRQSRPPGWSGLGEMYLGSMGYLLSSLGFRSRAGARGLGKYLIRPPSRSAQLKVDAMRPRVGSRL